MAYCVSTSDTLCPVAEECAVNPRVRVGSVDEHAETRNNLNLANPAMMDIAEPANLKMGRDFTAAA